MRAVGRGEVQIKGVDCGLYLAMNRRGRLYGEVRALFVCHVRITDEETIQKLLFDYSLWFNIF